RARSLFLATRLTEAAQRSPCPNPKLASTYQEAAMVFLAGTDTKMVRGPEAADFLHLGGCRLAFVEERETRAFGERAASVGLNYARLAEVSGFNYSDGKRMHFLLLMPKETQP